MMAIRRDPSALNTENLKLVAPNIHVPGQPRHLRLTDTMIEDFLCDPVLAVRVIFKLKLDPFQAATLRQYWWTQECFNSSGYSSGKSLALWLFCNLRCLLIGDQWAGIFYTTFEQMKQVFWIQYRAPYAHTPLFKAQLGNFEEDGADPKAKSSNKSAGCFSLFFRNESILRGPTPDWQREGEVFSGFRFNCGGVDEWTKVVNRIGKNANGKADAEAGITQLRGRFTRASWNTHHPLWQNHWVFTATAESRQHPAWPIIASGMRRVQSGDPRVAVFSFSFRDSSRTPDPDRGGKSFRDAHIDMGNVESMMASSSPDKVLREVFGLWSAGSLTWYRAPALESCVRKGVELGVEVALSAEEFEAQFTE